MGFRLFVWTGEDSCGVLVNFISSVLVEFTISRSCIILLHTNLMNSFAKTSILIFSKKIACPLDHVGSLLDLE